MPKPTIRKITTFVSTVLTSSYRPPAPPVVVVGRQAVKAGGISLLDLLWTWAMNVCAHCPELVRRRPGLDLSPSLCSYLMFHCFITQ